LRTAGQGCKSKSDYDDNQAHKEEHASPSQVVHREHHVIHSVSPTFLAAVGFIGCYLVGSLKGEGDEVDNRWRASLSQRVLLSRVWNSNSLAGPSTLLKTRNNLTAFSSMPLRVQ